MDEAAIVTINGDLDLLHRHRHRHRPTKNRTSALNLIRAALFMLRRPSAAKSPARIASKPLWKSLVVAVRPLHHHHHSPPPALPKAESFHDVHLPPSSPARSEASSASSPDRDRDQESVYASAQNLQELDESEVQDRENNGDEMIDSKAEEFIAHFYEQMRLQRLESMERYNAAIQRKSLIKIN